MVETITLLDTIRLITGITTLAYALYTDIKTRKAYDILWVIMGCIGAILLIVQYFTINFENLFILLFIPIMIAIYFVFYQFNLIVGGADLKALIALTILVPIEPSIGPLPLWKGGIMPFSWSIFANSLIMCLIIPISFLIFNIAKKNLELPYMFFGYKMNIKKAREKFVWPQEKFVNGKRKFIIMQKSIDAEEAFNNLEKMGKTEIWVTPKFPFMVPLFFGFLLAFIFGDILFKLFSFI